jgi:succinate dehydrogenase / fumarate reductase cytochrome b subunit
MNDGGEAFNVYAYFMTSNPAIKFISIGLYAMILLHTIQGILLYLSNKKKSGSTSASKYAVRTYSNGSWASKNMALLGTFILFFLCIHLGDFWYKMKFTNDIQMVTYEGYDYAVKDLYTRVSVAFQQWWIVLAYLVGLLALAFHLIHGWGSAFQTLGLRHKKYTPLINGVGYAIGIIIPLAYAIIPIWSYFK